MQCTGYLISACPQVGLQGPLQSRPGGWSMQTMRFGQHLVEGVQRLGSNAWLSRSCRSHAMDARMTRLEGDFAWPGPGLDVPIPIRFRLPAS